LVTHERRAVVARSAHAHAHTPVYGPGCGKSPIPSTPTAIRCNVGGSAWCADYCPCFGKVRIRFTMAVTSSTVGLVFIIDSILATISGVSLGRTATDLRFSSSCSIDDAPTMAVDTRGFRRTQAIACTAPTATGQV